MSNFFSASLKKHLHGFHLVEVNELQEFRARGALYIHEKTGAKVYHLEANDRENLAAFVFRTPPTDDTGVAHILEHTVLCGSQKFPTKDPFLHLAKSSLNTFLNAMTYPDKTVFPVATIVPKDFYNLFRVYADAVFHPLLKLEAFRQEGHRLEWDNQEGLLYSGVVYNEMKGNYSSAESVIYDSVQRALFDQGPYSFDSGGDPRSIPKLDYDQLVDFHRRHYHPQSSLILLYGDLPVAPALKILDREVFVGSWPNTVESSVKSHPRRSAPVTVRSTYPAQLPEEDGGTVALTWLTVDALDVDTILGLDILTEVLLGDAGVLHKTLLESGLAQDLSPVSGLETELKEAVFTVGLRGASADKAQQFESLVLHELGRWAREGLPLDLVEGVLATYEFSVKEVRGGGMGLRFLRRLMRGWIWGAKPAETLEFMPRMIKLRSRLAAGERVFEGLIETYLLRNPHRALVVCTPDPQKLAREEERVKEELSKLRIQFSSAEIETLKKNQDEVRAFQENPDSPGAIAKLPVLELRDIPRRVDLVTAVASTTGKIQMSLHEAQTNGISYLDLGFDLSFLNQNEWLLMPLWQRCLDGLGLTDLSYDLLARRLALVTGGLSVRSSADTALDGHLERRLWIRIKMLDSNIDPAMGLLESILTQTAWNNLSRLEDLVVELKNDFTSALVPRGHLYAAYRSSKSFSLASTISDWTGGLGQLDFLVAQKLESLESLASQLKQISLRVLGLTNLVASVTGVDGALQHLKKRLGAWSSLLSSHTAPPIENLQISRPSGLHGLRIIPATVGFNALTIPGTSLGQPHHEAELVLGNALRTGYLWEKIRMKGGAYGAMTFTSSLEGTFTFATYRDPHLIESLDAFREGLDFYRFHRLTRQELTNTILGTVSGDLAPRSPAEEGFLAVQRSLLGITDELRQHKRDALRRLSHKEFGRACDRLLAGWAEGISYSLTSSAIAEASQADQRYHFFQD